MMEEFREIATNVKDGLESMRQEFDDIKREAHEERNSNSTVLIVHRIVLFGPGSLLPRWRTEKQPRGRCQLFIIYKCFSELCTCIDRTCERNIDFLN